MKKSTKALLAATGLVFAAAVTSFFHTGPTEEEAATAAWGGLIKDKKILATFSNQEGAEQSYRQGQQIVKMILQSFNTASTARDYSGGDSNACYGAEIVYAAVGNDVAEELDSGEIKYSFSMPVYGVAKYKRSDVNGRSSPVDAYFPDAETFLDEADNRFFERTFGPDSGAAPVKHVVGCRDTFAEASTIAATLNAEAEKILSGRMNAFYRAYKQYVTERRAPQPDQFSI